MQYGRAFNSVYLLGDQGWALSTELAQPINFRVTIKPITVTPFVWYDYGSTNYKEGLLSDQTASTYGVGIRGNGLQLPMNLVGVFFNKYQESSHTGPENSVVYFNAGWRF